ncbi:MAG: carbamoyl-phosphate synthase domain-containing protein, partial [Pseudomonadales bacterium]|nr:carbamoyl-phosphate synthase domain-containing protein [Pseudomonadales bacterium]
MTPHLPCALALEDGSIFLGQSIGADGSAAGEVVFNTAMTGYQEILTDPSYRRQIVAMTSTQIGNYGVNEDDAESDGQHLAGFVVREAARRFSNCRANGNLATYLRAAGVIGLAGVDTRALTRRLRAAGAMRGVISTN